MRDIYQQRLDAEVDREYLMGGGRWRDDGSFVTRRPHTINSRYLAAARRHRLAWRARWRPQRAG